MSGFLSLPVHYRLCNEAYCERGRNGAEVEIHMKTWRLRLCLRCSFNLLNTKARTVENKHDGRKCRKDRH